MATATESKTSLVSLLRQIRKVMPKDTVKKSMFEYVVANRVIVVFNYYCVYGAEKENKTKECFPDSITISASVELVHKAGFNGASPSNIFKCRTIQLHNGQLNIEKFGVCINKCIKAVDDFIKRSKDEKEERRAKEAIELQKAEHVAKLLTKGKPRIHPWGSHLKVSNRQRNIEIDVWTNDDEDETLTGKYTIEIQQVSLEKLKRILEAAQKD